MYKDDPIEDNYSISVLPGENPLQSTIIMDVRNRLYDHTRLLDDLSEIIDELYAQVKEYDPQVYAICQERQKKSTLSSAISVEQFNPELGSFYESCNSRIDLTDTGTDAVKVNVYLPSTIANREPLLDSIAPLLSLVFGSDNQKTGKRSYSIAIDHNRDATFSLIRIAFFIRDFDQNRFIVDLSNAMGEYYHLDAID